MKAAETSYSKKFEGPLKNAVPKRRSSSSSSSSSGSKMPYTITTSLDRTDDDRTKPFSYIHEQPTISKSKLAKSASQKRAKERKLSSSSSSSSSDHGHVKGPKVKFVGKTKFQPKTVTAALPDVKLDIKKSDSDSSSSISSDSTTINMRSSAVTSPTDWGDSQAPSTEHLIKKADSWLNKATKPMKKTNLEMVESDSTSITSFTSTNDTDGQKFSIQKLNPVQTPVLNAKLVKHKGLNTSG